MSKKDARGPKPAAKGGRRDPRAEADRFVDIGIAAMAGQRPHEAVTAFNKALQLNPLSLDAHMNLATLLTHLGQQRSAVLHVKRALSLGGREPKVAEDASWALLHLGRWDLALPVLTKILAANPNDATALARLGFAYTQNGRSTEAVAALTRSVELEPSRADTHYELYRALYDDRSPAGSVPALKLAVKCDPDSLVYRFELGVLLDQCGDARGAREMFDGLGAGTYAGALESWHYIKSRRMPSTRIFSSTRGTLMAGLTAARPDGCTLEFGVRYGISTRWLAEKVETVHGFDSFEGLPEQWHVQPQGAYTTHGEMPELPSNVKLHVGWFDATLPAFTKENAEPVRFINVDCDLYSSTKIVFDQLASRIHPGAVLVFDEYVINDRWKDDEFKAFQEAVAEHKWRYEYLAFSVTDFQGAVRIL